MRRILLYLGFTREGTGGQLPVGAYRALAVLGAVVGVGCLIGGATVVGLLFFVLAAWMLGIAVARSR